MERAKDRWNAEIEGAVRWAQTKDWDEVREGVETAVARLWAKAFGDELEKVETSAQDTAAKVKADAYNKLDQSRAAASEKASGVAAAAKSAYADAKARGSDAAAKTGDKAEEAKGSIFGAIGGVFGRGKEAVSKAVGITEQKAGDLPSTLSAEEKALAQRYQGSSKLDQSPEQVLAARYGRTTSS